jgi:copper chaperone
MSQVIFQMEDLSCPSCIQKIEKVLSKQKGIEEVNVLFNAQKVKISFNEAAGNIEDYEDTLKKLGYTPKSSKITRSF